MKRLAIALAAAALAFPAAAQEDLFDPSARMALPEQLGETSRIERGGEPGFEDRAFAQGRERRRQERGMDAPRGFGETGRDAPRGYDGRASAQGRERRRTERGMDAPRGFGESGF